MTMSSRLVCPYRSVENVVNPDMYILEKFFVYQTRAVCFFTLSVSYLSHRFFCYGNVSQGCMFFCSGNLFIKIHA